MDVICQDCEDYIIQRFTEMEERDNKVMGEANWWGGNQLP